jgi:hypothetical protein
LSLGGGGTASVFKRGDGGVSRAEPTRDAGEWAEWSRVIDGWAYAATEGALEAGGAVEGEDL